MIDLLSRVIERHGWHAVAELSVLFLFLVFGVVYLVAAVRGRARAVPCRSCGRLLSRANSVCPRCGAPVEAV